MENATATILFHERRGNSLLTDSLDVQLIHWTSHIPTMHHVFVLTTVVKLNNRIVLCTSELLKNATPPSTLIRQAIAHTDRIVADYPDADLLQITY
jgi:hypothetical protein